jgi:hypothetical protein
LRYAKRDSRFLPLEGGKADVYGVLEGLTIMLLLRRYQHLAIGGPLCIKKENISRQHGDVIFVV